MKLYAICLGLCLLTTSSHAEPEANQTPETTRKSPNLLFIAVDDLKPQLGCYGESWMKTPNIDRLASKSRVFNRHYVQVATCGASQHAQLIGVLQEEYGEIWRNITQDAGEE